MVKKMSQTGYFLSLKVYVLEMFNDGQIFYRLKIKAINSVLYVADVCDGIPPIHKSMNGLFFFFFSFTTWTGTEFVSNVHEKVICKKDYIIQENLQFVSSLVVLSVVFQFHSVAENAMHVLMGAEGGLMV